MGSEGKVRFTHRDQRYSGTQDIYFGWKTPWWGTNRAGVRVVDGLIGTTCLWLYGDGDTQRDNTLRIGRSFKIVGTAQIVRDQSSPLLFFKVSRH